MRLYASARDRVGQRERCLPAEVLNEHGRFCLVEDDEAG
jgi:hypothetical protein